MIDDTILWPCKEHNSFKLDRVLLPTTTSNRLFKLEKTLVPVNCVGSRQINFHILCSNI